IYTFDQKCIKKLSI
ncbi:hypothetical protein, partial [Plasmodium yoelii yoelii]